MGHVNATCPGVVLHPKELRRMSDTFPPLVRSMRPNGSPIIDDFFLRNQATRDMYREGSVPKWKLTRKGKVATGRRQILMPSEELRKVQAEIVTLIVRSNLTTATSSAYAYRRKRSAKTMATQMVGQPYKLKLDFKNFFGSIRVSHINAYIASHSQNPRLAALLPVIERWCFLDGSLPQGAASSPILSNIAAINFDKRVLGLCKSWRTQNLSRLDPIIYARYCDDMIFASEYARVKDIRHPIETIAKSEGFTINQQKTRVFHKGNRNLILGMTTNVKLTLPKMWCRLLRQELRRITLDTANGLVIRNHKKDINGNIVPINPKVGRPAFERLEGQISYLTFIDKEKGLHYQRLLNIAKEVHSDKPESSWSPETRKYVEDVRDRKVDHTTSVPAGR